MSGPYDRLEIFRSHVPELPPSRQASVIKAQHQNVKNVAADIAAAVKASLTLPKAMPQLPPGVAIPLAPPAASANISLSGQAPQFAGHAGFAAQVQPAAVLFPPKAPSQGFAQDVGLSLPFPKAFSKAFMPSGASSSSSASGFIVPLEEQDELFQAQEAGENDQDFFFQDGAGNYMQLQGNEPEQQIEIAPGGVSSVEGFFPAIAAPSLDNQLAIAPQVVVPAQLPMPILKNIPLAEAPLPLPLPDHAHLPLHQHKLHEKQMRWEEVLNGIKEHIDGGHQKAVAKWHLMKDPEGDSDEEAVPVAQPQVFNEVDAEGEDIFGFEAVDAKQNTKTVQTYKTVYLARALPGWMTARTILIIHLKKLKRSEREYGAGSVLPECVRDCIRFASDSGLEELAVKSRYVARLLLRVHADLYETEQLEHMQLPPHLATLYKDKCFLFMERLALWAANDSPELRGRKDEVMSIFNKMKKGLSTRGEISASGFWKLLPESQRATNKREAEEEEQRQSLTAFKSDLKADVETEKRNREATKESATEEAASRYKADFNFLVKSAQKLEQRIEETVLGGEPFGFIPFSSKKDLSAYYYQFGVDLPELNRLWAV
eukprot:g13815.t1